MGGDIIDLVSPSPKRQSYAAQSLDDVVCCLLGSDGDESVASSKNDLCETHEDAMQWVGFEDGVLISSVVTDSWETSVPPPLLSQGCPCESTSSKHARQLSKMQSHRCSAMDSSSSPPRGSAVATFLRSPCPHDSPFPSPLDDRCYIALHDREQNLERSPIVPSILKMRQTAKRKAMDADDEGEDAATKRVRVNSTLCTAQSLVVSGSLVSAPQCMVSSARHVQQVSLRPVVSTGLAPPVSLMERLRAKQRDLVAQQQKQQQQSDLPRPLSLTAAQSSAMRLPSQSILPTVEGSSSAVSSALCSTSLSNSNAVSNRNMRPVPFPFTDIVAVNARPPNPNPIATAATTTLATTCRPSSLFATVTQPQPQLQPQLQVSRTDMVVEAEVLKPLVPLRSDTVYDVLLLVDKRERENALVVGSLVTARIPCELASLAVGDFLWVAVPRERQPPQPPVVVECNSVTASTVAKPAATPSIRRFFASSSSSSLPTTFHNSVGAVPAEEKTSKAAKSKTLENNSLIDGLEDEILVLDCIAERKTVSDLASSLMDGRYADQKVRLKSTGIRSCLYIVEGEHLALPLQQRVITPRHIKTAMTVTHVSYIEWQSDMCFDFIGLLAQVEHDMHVIRTRSMDHSTQILQFLHKYVHSTKFTL
jgi:ERCC4-type nuclease